MEDKTQPSVVAGEREAPAYGLPSLVASTVVDYFGR
jgi:hypothetical protein